MSTGVLEVEPKLLLPRFYTPALSEKSFYSDGPRLRKLFAAVWKDPQTGLPMVLEPWQEFVLDRVLEIYPPWHPLAGELRHRQYVIVIPRQSGKSLLAGALSLYGMFLHSRQPNVVGVAGKNAAMASIVFDRLKNTVIGSPTLSQYFKRVPSTRTMLLRNGGQYALFPASGGAVQGQPVTWGTLDELHLAKSGDLWADMVIGQRAQSRSMLVAITTAGDEGSQALLTLMDQGQELCFEPDPESRFGYIEYSAPPEISWNSPEAILSCNPRVVSGGISLKQVMEENKGLTKADVERYVLCRTVKKKNTWMDSSDWRAIARKWPELPDGIKPIVCSVGITPGSLYATLSLAGITDDGTVHGQVYASLPNPSTTLLADMCMELVEVYPGMVVAADSIRGKDLLTRLDEVQQRKITLNTIAEMSSWFKAATAKRMVFHDGNDLLERQLRKAEAKQLPKGGYKLVTADHSDLDALYSFVSACYFAKLVSDEGPEKDDLFVFP